MNTFDYADSNLKRPPSRALWRWTFWLWLLPAVIGVGCLLAFAVAPHEEIAMAGFLFILPGAVLTLASFVIGCVYSAKAWKCGFLEGASKKRAALAILLPLSNIALAIGCMVGGIALHSYYSSADVDVTVVNQLNEPITRLGIDAGSFDGNLSLTKDNLPPGESFRVQGRLHSEFSVRRTVLLYAQTPTKVYEITLGTNVVPRRMKMPMTITITPAATTRPSMPGYR
jgi:hypothetical protein